MKSKLLSLFGLSIFALVFSVGFITAGVDFINVTGATQSAGQGSVATVTFVLQEDGHGNLTSMSFNTPLTLTSNTNSLVSASSVTGAVTSLNQSDSSSAMTLTFNVPSSQAVGVYTGNLTLTGTYASTVTYDLPLSITVTSDDPAEIVVCEAVGNPGELKVKTIDFKNEGMAHAKFGDDDEWFPLDDIEVEVKFENDGDDDVDDIEFEWGIYDTDTREWIIDLDEEDEFNLKDGGDETYTLTFDLEDDLDVDLEDLDGGDTYRFYVVARGTVDNDANDETCVTDYETAEIIIESDFVVVEGIEVPEIVQCGDSIEFTADVWNIGEDDQDDVSVFVKNTELGLVKDIMVGDVDAFDNQKMSFMFEIPQDAEEKTYAVKFEVYDEDNDLYENDHDEDDAVFFFPLKVEGACAGVAAEASVSATLESGGKAGDEMVVRATVTNNEDEPATFSLSAAGYADWANSVSLDQSTLVLNAGDSRDVLFTFDVNKDASGSQNFFIELVSDGEVTRQPVSVSIEPRTGGFGGITGGVISEDNWYLWGIGLLNIILVIIIIVVAVKVARR
jgi:uncharacterized membrane protein